MGGASLSNFFITVIVKTLETSQLCKASFLVLSCNLFGYKLPVAIFGITWIWPWGRWRPPGSMRVTRWRPACDAPTIFTGRADRSGGVGWEVGHWHGFDSTIQRISKDISNVYPVLISYCNAGLIRSCWCIKLVDHSLFVLFLFINCTHDFWLSFWQWKMCITMRWRKDRRSKEESKVLELQGWRGVIC